MFTVGDNVNYTYQDLILPTAVEFISLTRRPAIPHAAFSELRISTHRRQAAGSGAIIHQGVFV